MDRFYPLGLPASEDAWKTTYEVQSEMRSFERSAYPPGTAIHQPGARALFGYSNPGPLASRLSQPHLTNREEVGQTRANHAIPRLQEPEDAETFAKHDVPEMLRSYNSPVARMSLSHMSKSSISRSCSAPMGFGGNKTTVPPRSSEPSEAVTRLEDEHFTYFVPTGRQGEGRERLCAPTLSKLPKVNSISFPFTGEGTGFSAQNPPCEWFPKGSYKDQPTTSKEAFRKPAFYRFSPLAQAGMLGLVA